MSDSAEALHQKADFDKAHVIHGHIPGCIDCRTIDRLIDALRAQTTQGGGRWHRDGDTDI